ncbi:NADP-dependent 3-hydroxy acid dehydrogenase YdfG [Quadrisphaera granulorum]|uniref:NADP-dependent 3-hydroxy acid dehydrogenase YdfG n=1 Tax=Quadrisphaera granulorum TaxID=317664 RepID=A0A316AS83_9ACTN|nr:SDR family NAD(P)-dependent oxidoreductase [Quadrisphaera granulorum]PWJ52967.1 NADP-dependent 3-hydroxy acid dehydrogenase YdfG [Quadrisphaera granulorum]SZE97349.1 NADP-dependent 3-hydroxy acid dehydrogenase YdfG [Quadrisphaera granulorum]
MAARAWITGGGSGVGAACALALAAAGLEVIVSGRRGERLEAVAAAVRATGGAASALPLDVGDPDAVAAAGEVLELAGGIDVFVAAAGLNTRRRHWDDLDLPALDAIVAANLTGLAHCAAAVLPGMRDRGDGLVVVISSRAAVRDSPGAGAAYRMSKTGAGALVASLNDDLAGTGVRATHLCPGDIATGFVDARPDAPDDAALAVMLTPDDVARVVTFVVTTPARVRIDELVVSPSATP